MSLSDATSVSEGTEIDSLQLPESTLSPAIMALQHKTLPFHGVQFHPESIESTWGHTIMTNFLDIVRQYWHQRALDEDTEISLDDHQCVFSWKGGLVTTRLVVGNYPDYAQIIPKAAVAEATLLKKDFEAALKRTAVDRRIEHREATVG